MPHDDFDIEPVHGLPEAPPEGETILWQGAPRAWPLAKRALNAQWIAAYFGALALWRGVVTAGEGGLREGLIAGFWYVLIGAVAVGVLAVLAWVMARAVADWRSSNSAIWVSSAVSSCCSFQLNLRGRLAAGLATGGGASAAGAEMDARGASFSWVRRTKVL